MAKTKTEDPPLKKGERVTAARDLRGIPEGSTGRVETLNGLTWFRYWVKWDDGSWLGSVGAADLVRSKDWEKFKERRAEEALRPKASAPDPSAATAPAAADAGAAGGRVPAHLLERSQRARERKAAASAGS